jgi:PAS domain S-box-containing protein
MDAQLLKAAQQWRTGFDAISEGICFLDRAGTVQRCNQAMTKLLNRSFGEVVGSRWEELVRGHSEGVWKDFLLHLGKVLRRESVDIPVGDQWLHVTGDPVVDETGAPSGFVIAASDITDRKRAEQALRDSEEQYRLLFDSVPSSVLLIDENLRVALANRNFLRKARRSPADTLGRPLNQVFPDVILEELGLERQIREAFASKQSFQGQRLTYRAPGVPLRTYAYSLIPILQGACAEHVMFLMDDVTEQIRLGDEMRQLERHLASVVESANEIVLSTDITGRILTWNRAAERLSGYTLYEVKGRFLLEYCVECSREQVRAFFAGEALQSGSGTAEYELITRKGAHIPVAWVFSPMKGDKEQIVGIVAVGRDLTERRKFEQQLLQSQKLAALGVMAGGIAHEIRTPLAISSSAAQFLAEDDITPEFRKECAEKVQVGIHRASVIIENLLRFAHPSAQVDMMPVNLSSALQEALTLIANQARIQKIEVACDFPAEPVLTLGIASLLEQVFLNLFLNALNAMPDGGSLKITLERMSQEAVVQVSDTGCGIASADIGKIFDPFYTRAPVGKGMGLGLPISYAIIQQVSGSIEVETVPGAGSTFTIRFPAL